MTNDGQQPGVTPESAMITTKAEQRRVGLIVAAIVSVAVIIIGLIVIIGASGDDDSATPAVTTTAGSSTPGTGGTSSPGRSEPPSDPCADAVLAADLQLAGATAAMCDGMWAVAEDSGGTTIAKFADDNAWHVVVDTATTAACRTEILNAGVPAAAVDAADWACELTTKPVTWASESGAPYSFGQMGGHVWAAQHVLAIWGLMPNKSVDGYLGPETLQALVTFQVAAGVPATGAVDQPTIVAMGIDPARRTASAPIVIQKSALNDIYLGSSEDGTVGALTKILGPPDGYYVPEFDPGYGACGDTRVVTWSGLMVFFARSSNGSLAFSAWIYRGGGPDLQIRARDGRTVGVQWESTSPKPEITGALKGYALLQWPDGLFALGADDGTIQSMLGGDPTCIGEGAFE